MQMVEKKRGMKVMRQRMSIRVHGQQTAATDWKNDSECEGEV